MLNSINQLRGLLLISLLFVITACGSDSNPYYVTEVKLTATQTTFAAGESQLVEGIAIYSTGEEHSASSGNSLWTSDDETIAVVDNKGNVTGISPGTTTIYATYSGSNGSDGQPVSGSISITITEAVLVGINIYAEVNSVPLGLNVQYQAFGTYGDGSTKKIENNSEMLWASSDSTVAKIDNTSGMTDTKGTGETTISVNFQGLSSSSVLSVTDASLVSVTISPSSAGETSVPEGYILYFTAEATYSDGSKHDVTQAVDWHSSDNTVLYTLSVKGEFEGRSTGESEVTATLETTTSNDILATVTNAMLEKVEIVSSFNEYPSGISTQLTAQAHFSNNTTKDITTEDNVSWQSDNTTYAEVGVNGILTAKNPGEVNITLTDTNSDSEVFTDIKPFTITDAELVDITITPEGLYLVPGQSHQYIATGVYTDGTKHFLNNLADIVWSISDTLQGLEIDGIVAIEPKTGRIKNYLNNGLASTDQVWVYAKVGDIISGGEGTFANLGAVRVLASGDLSFTGTFIQGDVEQLGLTITSEQVNVEDGMSGPDEQAFIMLTLAEADAVCTELVYNKHVNYRLPTAQELKALWDDKSSEPAVDNEFYTKYNWSVGKNYWTSTTDDSGETYKVIDLAVGVEHTSTTMEYNYVSCVRSPVSP